MRCAMVIAGRELRAYFLTPGGYIVMALFTLACGLVFCFGVFGTGQEASLRGLFAVAPWLLAFIAPAITMRLFSEEYRLGTFETLMTSPLREGEVVVGKFLGALGLLVLMLVPSGAWVIALELYGRPDYGEMMCGYLGLVLAGGLFLASGLLASTLTTSQPVAFLVTMFFWLTLILLAKLLPPHVGDRAADLIFAVDPTLRIGDFAIGLLDTSNVVYFLSATALFLLASIAALQGRRWR